MLAGYGQVQATEVRVKSLGRPQLIDALEFGASFLMPEAKSYTLYIFSEVPH